MSPLKRLVDEPQWVPLIAEFKFQHYRSIAKNKTLEDFRRGVEKDLSKEALPIGYVLTEKETFIGMVSLRLSDLDSHSHLTPWLGGIFVHPDWRGQGIGTFLVKEGERIATEKGFQ